MESLKKNMREGIGNLYKKKRNERRNREFL